MRKQVELFIEQLDVHRHRNEWFVSIDAALDGMTSKEAAWRWQGSNTIWQIVNHLIFWNDDVIHRLNGTVNPRTIQNNDASFGEPGNAQDETGWAQTVSEFHDVMQRLDDVITRMDDSELDLPYAAQSDTKRRLLSNIMMHDTYHIGQIVLMRKLQSSWTAFDWE